MHPWWQKFKIKINKSTNPLASLACHIASVLDAAAFHILFFFLIYSFWLIIDAVFPVLLHNFKKNFFSSSRFSCICVSQSFLIVLVVSYSSCIFLSFVLFLVNFLKKIYTFFLPHLFMLIFLQCIGLFIHLFLFFVRSIAFFFCLNTSTTWSFQGVLSTSPAPKPWEHIYGAFSRPNCPDANLCLVEFTLERPSMGSPFVPGALWRMRKNWSSQASGAHHRVCVCVVIFALVVKTVTMTSNWPFTFRKHLIHD